MSITDHLLEYINSENTLRDTIREGKNLIELHEFNGFRWLYQGGRSIQSAMRVKSPSELVLPSYQAMLSLLLFVETPVNLLNLGFGAGAIERFFWKHVPQLDIVSVDVSPSLVSFARKHFFIPDDRPVVMEPAEKYLCESQQTFDIILCDIFTSEAEHADSLFTASFYQDLGRCLSKGGMVSINLAPANEQELVTMLQLIRQHFTWVTICTVPEHSNVILLLSNDSPPSSEVLLQRVDRCTAEFNLDLSDAFHRMQVLPGHGE